MKIFHSYITLLVIFFSQFVEKGFRFVLNFCFAASTENTLVGISFFEYILIFAMFSPLLLLWLVFQSFTFLEVQ